MVYTYAEHFNQIARAVNLLTRARLYLPVRVKWQSKDYYGQENLTVQGDGNCFNGAVWADQLTLSEPTTLTATGAVNEETGSFTLLSYQRVEIGDDGGQCIIRATRRDIDYFIDFSPLALNALADDLHTLVVTDQSTGFAAAVDDVENTHSREVVATEAESWGFGGGANGSTTDYQDDLGQWQNWVSNNSTVTTCEIVKSGTLKSDLPSISDYVDTFDGGFGEGSNSERRLVVNNIEAYVEVPLV